MENSVSRVKSPVVISCALTTAPVTPPVIRPSVFAPAVVTRSPPITACASPVATRIAVMSSGRSAMRRWMCTAPPFCARPAISIMPAPRPSSCAACASTAPIVTTPVPPTPVMTTLCVPWMTGSAGSGNSPTCTSVVGSRRTCAPSTVTKLGQNPLRQLMSKLHDDWSTARLRPSSVSTGTSETQFDCTPQSPQPSQMSVLMNTRFSDFGNVPLFLRRRFSAAQVCT